ncbi:MAG: Uma2 family endonuclease [Sulfurimonas sp.]|nr:Uma2 family endonuclease [Sulfurimonas sp.]
MGVLKIKELNYTYDDYKIWEGDWELIDGLPISMAPAPMIKHQSLEFRFAKLFDDQIEDCERCEVLSEVDYKVSDDTVLRPDVVVICDEPNDAYLTKAPEIVVEIISKSTAKRDEKYKFEIYEREKISYYILVYPDELIAKVYKLESGKYDKQGDFYKQKYRFDNTTCKPEIDFNNLFEKYRK